MDQGNHQGTSVREGHGIAANEVSGDPGVILETVVSPFHCLYQDAVEFHQQSRLRLVRSEAEASRLARASLLLYVASAESLVHQAAAELGRPELVRITCDPKRPLPLYEVWRLLPALVVGALQGGGPSSDPDSPPWPQFAELLALRDDWAFPGAEPDRRAYYHRALDAEEHEAFEPMEPHQIPASLNLPSERLVYPRTGLPRDPYALRPRHLDTARGVLDDAIAALDRLLDGALTRGGRHRREPVRIIRPS